MMRWLNRLVLLLLLGFTFWTRTYNREEVFHDDGRIYFVEGDCYSRMTRAKLVTQGEWVIRHHDFENWPQGTVPHTTAPMDWLIVGAKTACDVALKMGSGPRVMELREQSLDLAGALISPLLAVATAAWLWWWVGWMRLPFRGWVVFFFAISPIIAHGTVLGRPDHQSLLIFLLAIAVGAELALADLSTPARLARRWAWVAGLGWGAALWVSLYEPAIFFAGAVAWHLMSNRVALYARAVRGRWIGLGIMMVVALAVDGWRLSMPDQTLRDYFLAWSKDIGELRHLGVSEFLLWNASSPDPVLAEYRVGLVWQWLGGLWLTAPLLLWMAGRYDPRARGILPLYVVMLGLSVWQLRWGYFAALAIAVSLPWQLSAIRQRWIGALIGGLAMIPILWGWVDLLHPSQRKRDRQAEVRAVTEEYRRLAELMRSKEKEPFLAPWWVSPSIAYWSGQPGVAGTSHQSLPGTVDSARFYLAQKPEEGAAILKNRDVHWVIVDDLPIVNTDPPQYAPVNNSARILGQVDAKDQVLLPWEPLGWKLAESARLAPDYLRPVSPEERGLVIGVSRKENGEVRATSVKIFERQLLKIYEVLSEKL